MNPTPHAPSRNCHALYRYESKRRVAEVKKLISLASPDWSASNWCITTTTTTIIIIIIIIVSSHATLWCLLLSIMSYAFNGSFTERCA